MTITCTIENAEDTVCFVTTEGIKLQYLSSTLKVHI